MELFSHGQSSLGSNIGKGEVLYKPATMILTPAYSFMGSYRIVANKTVQLNGFLATLDMNLLNGAYLIIISTQDNGQTVKKLLISK